MRSIGDKDFSPFTKREIYDDDDEEDDDTENANEEENYNLKKYEDPIDKELPAMLPKEQASMALKAKKQPKIDIPLSLLSKKIGKANGGDIKNKISENRNRTLNGSNEKIYKITLAIPPKTLFISNFLNQ